MHALRVQTRSIRTLERADETLARLEAGNFDTIFLNVFAYGHAFYESDLLEKHPQVDPGFDPLQYILDWAKPRGVAVHAWLVAGPVTFNGDSPILAAHPDWQMLGPDGKASGWLNYTRPDVRAFIGDLALEIATKYPVAGIHFDYTRYPGPEWGFDPYSIDRFTAETGTDLNVLRYADLPAYGVFRGFPLSEPTTAQVLAKFQDSWPAVMLNRYGDGEVILLNWDAADRNIAAGGEILKRSINYLGKAQPTVYLFYSELMMAQRGPEEFEGALAWLQDLGWQPAKLTETALASLPDEGANLTGTVLVMPNIYRMSDETAAHLADFVRQGGGLIFIDSPRGSIDDSPDLRAITGMAGQGEHFDKKPALLLPLQAHEIIPVSDRTWTLPNYLAVDARWKAFRADKIDTLLQTVYARLKQANPDLLVSITVTADQEILANRHMLNWQNWLKGGYIDMLNPRAYVSPDEPLEPVLAPWQPYLADSGRLVISLSTHDLNEDDHPLKQPQRMQLEIEQALAAGSNGVIIFNAYEISDEILHMLATGPFSGTLSTANLN